MTEPIDAKYRDKMNAMAKGIDHLLNGSATDKKTGFALLMFDFGESGNMNYISNASRADMIAALKGFIIHAEEAE